jgi:TetR/AcrR family tetracycline transcriptional repressor
MKMKYSKSRGADMSQTDLNDKQRKMISAALELLAKKGSDKTDLSDEQQKVIDAALELMLEKGISEMPLSERQQKIIDAALELLTETGFNELSLRDIAKRLGVKAPAIYKHFKNKETLVDYMAECILQKELKDLQPIADGENWQDWLTSHIAALRRAMLAYPDGGRVVAGAHLFPAVTLAKLMEYSLESLCHAGLDLQTAKHIYKTAVSYTFGSVIEEQSDIITGAVHPAEVTAYPKITEAMSNTGTNDEEFLIGLKYIVR